MNYADRERLKERVARKLDIAEFLDILGWTMWELVEELPDDVFDQYGDELERACG